MKVKSMHPRLRAALESLGAILLVLGFLLSAYQVWHVEHRVTTADANGKTRIDFLWPTYTPQRVRYGEYLARRYMEENPEVYVNLMLASDPYAKLQVMIAGRTAPDVTWMGVGWQQFVNALLPLDGLASNDPEVGPQNFSPTVWESVKWNGTLYALPTSAQTAVMYYNKDLFDDARIPYPTADWTWDDMVRIAKALTHDDNGDGMIDRYGVQLQFVYEIPFIQYPGPIADPTWREATVDNPVTVAILESYRDLIYKDRVMPTPTTSRELGSLPMFEAGRLGLYASAAHAIESFRKCPYDWDVVTFPWYEFEGKRYRSTGLWQEEFCILWDTDIPDEAWKFARWCAGQDLIRWATENGHIVPARLDVAYSPALLNPNLKPANARAFVDSWEFAIPIFEHPSWKRMALDFDAIIQQYLEGSDGRRITAPECARQLDSALQTILDDYRAAHPE